MADQMKVFCPAWAMVLAQRPELRERITRGEATPTEVTQAFKESFQLNAMEAAGIKSVLALTDLKDFVHNQVSLDAIMTRGAAIHVAIDFGIERLRSELKAAGVDEAEITRQTNARFDEVFGQFAVNVGGQKVVPISAKDIAHIVKENVKQLLAKYPDANDSVLRSEIDMAGELAAAAAFTYAFMAGPNLPDGRKSLAYDDLRKWFTQSVLPDRRVSDTPSPNPFSLTAEAAIRLAPGAIVMDLERSVSHIFKGIEIALGFADSTTPINRGSMTGAQVAGRCPYAGQMLQTLPTSHPDAGAKS